MRIKFWGATEDVTGSMTFVELDTGTVLIDCGLAQGQAAIEDLNTIPFPLDPEKLNAVVITHAHLDHCGYLPHLIKLGYNGPIFCTPATSKLIRIILNDSAHLVKEDFYQEQEVIQTLQFIRTKEWKETFEIAGIDFMFVPSAHILGASSVLISTPDKKIIFSGDLGRYDDPLLPPLTDCSLADVIVMESTYGGKVRTKDPMIELAHFLNVVHDESRIGIIASFAVARAQTLLTLIHLYFLKHPDKKVRIVLDSPMMKEANVIYQQHAHLTKYPELVFESLEDLDSIDYAKEWAKLKKKSGPLLIIASSGMLTGGRIHRHLQNWHKDQSAILFLPGYQGLGTPGRSMIEGHHTIKTDKIEEFEWRGEVWGSEAFSSHADQNELIHWLGDQNKNSHVFLIHGESQSKADLKAKLTEHGFTKIDIPSRGDVFTL